MSSTSSPDREDRSAHEPALTDSYTLRFPTAESNEQLSNWVYASSSAIMSEPGETMSDHHDSLANSSYEFIDTDSESRDDRDTESVASTDYGATPESVVSLADSDHSDAESDVDSQAAEEAQPIPSFHGLDGPVETPTIGRSTTEYETASSIEFMEPMDLGAEEISVKHTIRNYTEHEAWEIGRQMLMQVPRTGMTHTIRQTMTKQGLSTKEPLRILYIGSHSAKQDIIHKIASSVTASVGDKAQSRSTRQSASQMYNVVPVSAFGSERTPEIELMHSSGIQINVQDCISASIRSLEDRHQKEPLITLNMEDDFSYRSVPHGNDFIVEPEWELPHVAVFYLSESDNEDARCTQGSSAEFMARHKIPSIFISHKEPFEKGMNVFVTEHDPFHQHALHTCLEYRDSAESRTVIHRRLPIELASFLNIDARQMNRNLAYLTGLYEPEPPKMQKASRASRSDKKSSSWLDLSRDLVWSLLAWNTFAFLLPLCMSILFMTPSFMTSDPALSINGGLSSAARMISEFPTGMLSSPAIGSLKSTSTSVQVSTKTMTVTESQSSGSDSKALSPFRDVEKLLENILASYSPPQDSNIFKAEICGDNSVLIRVPPNVKSTWLEKEALSFNISRASSKEGETVELEALFMSELGPVLQFSKEEAYGLLNIEIITRRKPRIRENLQVQFSSSLKQDVQDAVKWFSTRCLQTVNLTDLWARQRSFGDATLAKLDELSETATQRAADSVTQVLQTAGGISEFVMDHSRKLTSLWDSETRTKLDDIREPLDISLLSAQVRSKLFWLKLQGKDEEHDEYRRRAEKLIRERTEGLKETRQAAQKASQKAAEMAQKNAAQAAQKAAWASKKAAKREAEHCKRQGNCDAGMFAGLL